MKYTVIYCILFLCTFTLGQLPAESEYYTAAVVEYATIYNETQSPGVNIRKNVEEYVINIRKAKEQGADIIVFPECGLTTTNLPVNIPDLQLYTTVIPDADERVVPCKTDKYSDVLKELSCAAQTNGIYVVVNLPERSIIDNNDSQEEKILIFNTNIVFDRKGTIIAKYRKYNLFVEPGFNVTETPDITTFETDFGVTFGTFICFDILFAKPALQMLSLNANVTDIVYPTAWFSELPFLTAVQTQAGWARSTGVNLLAAGYSNPKQGSGGSGVFQAIGKMRYTVPVNKITTLIVERVHKIKHRITPDSVDINTASVTMENVNTRSKEAMVTMKENMKNYTTVLINDTIDFQKICHGKFCCSFSVKFPSAENYDYRYRLVAYDGPRLFGIESNNVQICGVVACKDETQDSCGERTDRSGNPQVFEHISIIGDFRNDDNTVVFPSNTLYNLGVLKPSDFEYIVSSSGRIEMRTTEVQKLLGFGIYGITKSSAVNSFPLLPLIVLTFVSIIAINKCYMSH